jgi:hypothetical protein
MAYAILESENFRSDLEEAAMWLYIHNLEQSQNFADRKLLDLENEIENLKTHLTSTPSIGQEDESSILRRLPVYDGRYLVTWITNEKSQTVTLLALIDSKYPRKLREFSFDG